MDNNNDSKKVVKKPWYKHWWIWAIAIVVVLAIVVMTNSNDEDETSPSNTDSNNYVRLDGHKLYYVKSKKYKLNNITDNSWSNATVKINNVTVYKMEKGYTYGTKRGKKNVQGMLAVNLTVKALKDIDVDMDDATIALPDINQQSGIETKDEWDDIDKGISKTGILYVPIYKLNNVKDVKQLRLKFDCESNSDQDIDNYDHTYRININL